VPDNVRRGRPQGKRHRKQTANRPKVLEPSRSKGETVRQERTARTVTDAARQAPPGARPNRDGIGPVSGLPSGSVARGVWQQASQRNGHPSGLTARGQNPAYRPSDVSSFFSPRSEGESRSPYQWARQSTRCPALSWPARCSHQGRWYDRHITITRPAIARSSLAHHVKRRRCGICFAPLANFDLPARGR
jgi:hypothetical protein